MIHGCELAQWRMCHRLFLAMYATHNGRICGDVRRRNVLEAKELHCVHLLLLGALVRPLVRGEGVERAAVPCVVACCGRRWMPEMRRGKFLAPLEPSRRQAAAKACPAKGAMWKAEVCSG